MVNKYDWLIQQICKLQYINSSTFCFLNDFYLFQWHLLPNTFKIFIQKINKIKYLFNDGNNSKIIYYWKKITESENSCGGKVSKLLIEEGYKKNERIQILSELSRNKGKKKIQDMIHVSHCLSEKESIWLKEVRFFCNLRIKGNLTPGSSCKTNWAT